EQLAAFIRTPSLLGSLGGELLGHALAAFCLASEFNFIAHDGAGVIQNDFASASHLLLFEFNRVSADGSFLDRHCASASPFDGSRQLASFVFQSNGHHLRSSPSLNLGSPLSVNLGLAQDNCGDGKHAD